MLCFLTTNWGAQKSGIEMAMLERISIFNKHYTSFKLITTLYNRKLHYYTDESGIATKNVINLFDFFAGDVNTASRKYGIDEYRNDVAKNIQIEATPNENEFYGYILPYQSQTRLTCLDILLDPDTKQIDEVKRYGFNGKLLTIQYYDSRGWLAVEQILDNQGLIRTEKHFNSKGENFYSCFWQPKQEINGNLMNAPRLHQLTWEKHMYSFFDSNDMITFFLDNLVNKINSHLSRSYYAFIVDRTNELAYPVTHMHEPVVKYGYLHSDHVNDQRHPNTASINYNYEHLLKTMEKWDGIIMATKRQEEVFTARYHDKVKTYVIPVGFAHKDIKHVAYDRRNNNEVIEIARLSSEKRQDHLIRAFEIVHKVIPDASLHFYGFANDNFDTKLHQLTKQLHLEDVVHFHDYTEHLDDVYNHAQLAVLPSTNEGFGLSIIEGLEHGVPTIAYNVPYGAQEMIKNGYNGFLALPNNIDDLASDIMLALQDKKLAQKMSENAYQSVERFYEKNVWKLWLQLMKDSEDANQRQQTIWRYLHKVDINN